LTDQDADSDQKPFHYEHGVPVFDISRVDKLEREQSDAKVRDDEYKREQLGVNKWVMRFTGALVLCSIIGGGVSFYQARVARWNAKAASDMVDQMRTSGNDTHELAAQAKNQADRTKDVADRALTQANATNELARQARGLPMLLRKLLIRLQGSLNLAKNPLWSLVAKMESLQSSGTL